MNKYSAIETFRRYAPDSLTVVTELRFKQRAEASVTKGTTLILEHVAGCEACRTAAPCLDCMELAQQHGLELL